ncbi:hypothetical protein ES708_19493 [subsurface metagenome]
MGKITYLSIVLVLITSCTGRNQEKSLTEPSKITSRLNDEVFDCNDKAFNLIEKSKAVQQSLKDSLLAEAISLIDDCLKQDSSFVSYYVNKANAFYNLNKFNGAIVALEDGFNYTNHPSLLFTIGILYEKEGDNTKASVYFTNALTRYDSLLSTGNYTPSDEINREYVKLMLYGKRKTIEDLKDRKKMGENKERVKFLIDAIEPLTKDQIISSTFN